ncbi:hypothetical protein [Marininema halotolerans]|uniref:Uncharacterized protein n=1 Tax=Marininema halotolerans TaxID=1155944 RepID=A0A1I6U050_9BACL|nr:hypothetical protein [Marininema halotolerans]SFS94846.1 hypothetical protein SAMN05444972_11269 [Marininema halotolerans]
MKDFRFAKVTYASLVLCFVMLFAASSTFAAATRYFVCTGAITYFQNIDASKYDSVTFNFPAYEPEELNGLEVCVFVPFTPNQKCENLDGSQNSITMNLDDPTKTYTLKLRKSKLDLDSITGTYTLNDRE